MRSETSSVAEASRAEPRPLRLVVPTTGATRTSRMLPFHLEALSHQPSDNPECSRISIE